MSNTPHDPHISQDARVFCTRMMATALGTVLPQGTSYVVITFDEADEFQAWLSNAPRDQIIKAMAVLADELKPKEPP